jgi:hypothetical protein
MYCHSELTCDISVSVLTVSKLVSVFTKLTGENWTFGKLIATWAVPSHEVAFQILIIVQVVVIGWLC